MIQSKAVSRTVQVIAFAVANILGSGVALAQKTGGTTTKTIEQYFFDVTEIPVSQTIETYATTIDGFLAGSASPLVSFSFSFPLGDAAVQASFASIRHSLSTAASAPLSFTGPTLESSVRNQVSTSVVGVNNDFDRTVGTILDVRTDELVGEENFAIPFGGHCTGLTELYSFCETRTSLDSLFVAAGDTVLLTSADILYSVTRTVTTTNTFLTTQRYSIVGTPSVTSPVPEPSTLLLMAPLIALIAFRKKSTARLG